MEEQKTVIAELQERFPEADFREQKTADNIPTAWVKPDALKEVLSCLKNDVPLPYKMLFDMTAIDERVRREPAGQPECDFSAIYTLLSIDRNCYIRLKTPLYGEYPSIPTITDLWPNANWYEREVWDMFGINVENHPFLKRILLPPEWEGHPLRKEYAARATEMEPFTLPEEIQDEKERELKVDPAEYGLSVKGEDTDYLILNFGPHHIGTHGLLRIILQLDGEKIVDSACDIGWHHRGAEKMAERQTFHTYIPYTDRVDYLAGLLNEMPYLLSVEKICGIDVPPRAQAIRVMLSELWRIASHLVWFGTYGSDVGALSPVFFTFNDRERIYDIMEAICGFRMHPGWFRIGGVASNLPDGWRHMVEDFTRYFPARIDEYEKMIVKNRIFQGRARGVGVYTQESAVEWGVTGPNLRATGINWDLRKKQPYSGYEKYDFEIPTASDGDSYARCVVRMEEMRQSLRIVEQAMENMPAGRYKSDSRYAMPPAKEQTMLAIETLINHFLSVSWGQPVPAGEAMIPTEGAKGNYGYHVISDGSNYAYRCRIRTASFPHIQTLPMLCRGLLVSDLITILGSIDFVLADVDR